MYAERTFRHRARMRKRSRIRKFLPSSPAAAAQALWQFTVGVFRDFRANQGLLLAGAVCQSIMLRHLQVNEPC